LFRAPHSFGLRTPPSLCFGFIRIYTAHPLFLSLHLHSFELDYLCIFLRTPAHIACTPSLCFNWAYFTILHTLPFYLHAPLCHCVLFLLSLFTYSCTSHMSCSCTPISLSIVFGLVVVFTLCTPTNHSYTPIFCLPLLSFLNNFILYLFIYFIIILEKKIYLKIIKN